MITIKETNQIVKKIIHIADIHIRLSSRHKEYREVFDEFYNDLVMIKIVEPNSIVCLCGDLLESKDELKPDTIYETWDFIKNISIIFPLFIITGNHDIIEHNKNKKDSIEAILEDRPIDNIYYMKESGIYIYENIIFGVSSIVDKKTIHIKELEKFKNNKISIGLYHGAVENGRNNFNFIIPNCKKLSDFGDYDYILLGDIHKYQYLDEKKRVAYCSSMISQNMSETDDNHGYLEWDIISGISKYHILRNKYAYNKIKLNKIIDNNKINYNKIKKYLPNISLGHLRIEYEKELDEKEINKKEIKDELLIKYPLLSITIVQKYKKEIEETDNKIIIKENRNKDELIRKYLKIKEDIEDKDLIELIINKFNSISEDNNKIEYIGSEWKILLLNFDYMYGYGPNNVIDFTKYPDKEIIGIFGENAIGKSSLIDIITFILYSKTAREDTLKDIININSNTSKGTIILESSMKKYIIRKTCFRDKRKKTGNHIETKMEMFRLIETEDINSFHFNNKYYKEECLTEKDRYKTTDVVETIIGDMQNFILTSVLLQGNINTFKQKDNKQKKEYLCKILDIDYFSIYEKEINENYKKLKYEIQNQHKIIEKLSNKTLEELNAENLIIIEQINNNKLIKKDLLFEQQLKEKEKSNMYLNLKNLNQNITIKNNQEKLLQLLLLKENEIKRELIDNSIIEFRALITRGLSIEYYNNALLELELNEKNIIVESNELERELYKNELIENIIGNIEDIPLLTIQLNIIIKEKEELENTLQIIYNKARELKLLKKKENIIEDNKRYQEDNKHKIIIVNELIKKTIIATNTLIYKPLKINKSIEELENYLKENNNNFKENIHEEYKKYIESKKDLLYDKIKNLNHDIIIDLSIKEILDLLDIILNHNDEFINEYNRYIKLEEYYNEIKEELIIMEYNENITEQLEDKRNTIQQLEEQLNEINNRTINIEDYNNLQNEIDIEQIYLQEIEKIKNSIIVHNENLHKLTTNLLLLEKIEENNIINKRRLIKIEELNRRKNKLELELKEIYNTRNEIKGNIANKLIIKESLDKLILEYNTNNLNINTINKELEDYNRLEEYIIMNEKTNNNILDINNLLVDLTKKLENINKEIIMDENRIEINNNKIDNYLINNNELERLEKEYLIYGYLNSMVGLNGIQLYLLSEYLETISDRINNILEPFIKKEIRLVLNKDKIEIKIIYENKQIYTLSGMESFMLDLSLIIIINEISEIPKSNIMFIDESISVLDKDRIENINDLFLFMKYNFNQVYMITHMKQVKSQINYSLEISKKNNYSKIFNI
jgi:DNA repair exonuclease SbcCD ATPase subunit